MLLSDNGGMQNAKKSGHQIGEIMRNLNMNVVTLRNIRRMLNANNKSTPESIKLDGIAYSKFY